jgi:hypothetical protein
MVMQATLDGYGLKREPSFQELSDTSGSLHAAFTKALTCLSRYGDDLTIYGTPETLSISATNSSMSAYCRFKYSKQFFSRYNVGPSQRDDGALGNQAERVSSVTGQLLTKVSLSHTCYL